MQKNVLTRLPQRSLRTDFPDFNPLDLLPIFEDEKQIHIVYREPQAEITRYLAQVSDRLGNGFRLIIKASEGHPEHLEQILQLPEAAGKTALLSDISILIQLFADLLDCPSVAIRLEVLQHAMCPKFHIDHTGIRLLCTYLGPGTEWLDEHACNREVMGQSFSNIEAFHAALILHPPGIRQAASQALALLKGSAWQGNEHAGIIHRSPQTLPGQTRALLCLDAIW